MKQFINVGENVIIAESGLQSPIPYRNNIQELLSQQEVTTILEQELERLENWLNSKEKQIPDQKKKVIKNLCVAVGAAAFLELFNIAIASNNADYMISPEVMTYCIRSFEGLFVGASLFDSVPELRRNKKSIEGYKTEIEFLREIIKTEKRKMELLEQDDKSDNMEGAPQQIPITIDINDRINEIREQTVAAYNYGENRGKFLRMYNKGILAEKLSPQYSPSGLSVIEGLIAQDIEKSIVKSKAMKVS